MPDAYIPAVYERLEETGCFYAIWLRNSWIYAPARYSSSSPTSAFRTRLAERRVRSKHPMFRFMPRFEERDLDLSAPIAELLEACGMSYVRLFSMRSNVSGIS